MLVFSANQLETVAANLFEAVGTPKEEARRVACSLVKSNLVGVDGQGIIRIPWYIKLIKEGQIVPGAKMEIVKETPSIALVNGNWGFGQVIAEKCMKIAIHKAKSSILSAIGIFNCNHVGRLGEYSMMAGEENMIGLITCNGGDKGRPLMVPYRGSVPRFGTNPISVAVPAGKFKYFLLDFATSVASIARIMDLLTKDERVPNGWIIDKHGNASTDPHDFFNGGAVLPFGEHKGYGLALLIDILSGMLTGAGCPSSKKFPRAEGKLFSQGVFMMAINIEGFLPVNEFIKDIEELLSTVAETPPAQGYKKVLIPGELEFRIEEERLKKGIPIQEKVWREITKIACEVGVNVAHVLSD